MSSSAASARWSSWARVVRAAADHRSVQRGLVDHRDETQRVLGRGQTLLADHPHRHVVGRGARGCGEPSTAHLKSAAAVLGGLKKSGHVGEGEVEDSHWPRSRTRHSCRRPARTPATSPFRRASRHSVDASRPRCRRRRRRGRACACTPCTSITTCAFSIRLSLLADQSSVGPPPPGSARTARAAAGAGGRAPAAGSSTPRAASRDPPRWFDHWMGGQGRTPDRDFRCARLPIHRSVQHGRRCSAECFQRDPCDPCRRTAAARSGYGTAAGPAPSRRCCWPGPVAAAAGVMLVGWPHLPPLPGQAGAVAAVALVLVAVPLVFAVGRVAAAGAVRCRA